MKAIMNWFADIYRFCNPKIRHIAITVTVDGITFYGATAMTFSMTDIQSTTLSVTAADAAGAALALPAGAVVAYGVDNPAVVGLTPNADNLTAAAKALADGVANVTAVLSYTPAGASAPVTVTSAAFVISVVAGAIASITIVASTPTP